MKNKFCAACGHELAEGIAFCPACGARVAAEEQPVSVPSPTNEPAASVYVPTEPPKKSAKKWILAVIIPVICLVLVGGIALGAVTVLFQSPYQKLAKAVEKTMDCGNFVFESSVKLDMYGYDQKVSLGGTVNVDYDAQTLAVMLDGEYDGEQAQLYLCNDAFYIMTGQGEDAYAEMEELDDDYVDEFFEAYQKKDQNLTEEEQWEAFYDALKEAEVYEEFTDVVDTDAFEEAVQQAFRENLPELVKEDVDGGTKYTATINAEEYLANLLKTFEPAMKDEDAYDEIEDGLDEIGDLNLDDIVLSMTVTDGYWSGLAVSFAMDEFALDLELTMADFGQATLAEEDIQDFVDDCETAIDEQSEYWEDALDGDYDQVYDTMEDIITDGYDDSYSDVYNDAYDTYQDVYNDVYDAVEEGISEAYSNELIYQS